MRGRWLGMVEICWSALKNHLCVELLDYLDWVKGSVAYLIAAYTSFVFLCLKKPLKIKTAWRYRRALVIDARYDAWLDSVLTVQIC
jgi:hypothetical protein